jgi:hypothetical protein
VKLRITGELPLDPTDETAMEGYLAEFIRDKTEPFGEAAQKSARLQVAQDVLGSAGLLVTEAEVIE